MSALQTSALWQFTRYLILTALPFKLLNDASQFVGPIFLNLLLGVVSSGQPSSVGYTYALLMLSLLIIGTACDNQHFQRVMRGGTVLLTCSPLNHPSFPLSPPLPLPHPPFSLPEAFSLPPLFLPPFPQHSGTRLVNMPSLLVSMGYLAPSTQVHPPNIPNTFVLLTWLLILGG